MIRTSLYLPDTLHQRLLALSQREGKSFSALARALFHQALECGQEHDVAETYDALDALEGIGEPQTVDPANRVDEVLYGEKGAWRGDPGETGLWTLVKPERKNAE